MKKRIVYTFFIAVLTFSFGCKKDVGQSVSGTIKEYGTNIPMQNVNIILYKDHTFDIAPRGGTPVGWIEDLENVNTDSKGWFQFKETIGSNCFLRIEPRNIPSGYYTLGLNKIPATENGNIIFEPLTILKLHFINTSPFDSNDQLTSSYFYSKYLTGMLVDTTLITECFGNKNGTIDWEVTKNNITTKHDTTLYFPGKDTLSLNINY